MTHQVIRKIPSSLLLGALLIGPSAQAFVSGFVNDQKEWWAGTLVGASLLTQTPNDLQFTYGGDIGFVLERLPRYTPSLGMTFITQMKKEPGPSYDAHQRLSIIAMNFIVRDLYTPGFYAGIRAGFANRYVKYATGTNVIAEIGGVKPLFGILTGFDLRLSPVMSFGPEMAWYMTPGMTITGPVPYASFPLQSFWLFLGTVKLHL